MTSLKKRMATLSLLRKSEEPTNSPTLHGGLRRLQSQARMRIIIIIRDAAEVARETGRKLARLRQLKCLTRKEPGRKAPGRKRT